MSPFVAVSHSVSTELGPLWQTHIKLQSSRNLALTNIRQDIRSMASGIPIYDLATNGDVILTLRLTRLRVSSAVLSTASPAFRAMFGPDFFVGQNLYSPRHPKEIPLREDDSHGMMRLCYLVHHQRDPGDSSPLTVSSVPGAKEFLTMATLADKYGGRRTALVLHGPQWNQRKHRGRGAVTPDRCNVCSGRQTPVRAVHRIPGPILREAVQWTSQASCAGLASKLFLAQETPFLERRQVGAEY
jgi:hypothetical protein